MRRDERERVDAERRRAWRATKGDAAAAARLGIKTPTFAQWRIRHGLPPRGPGGRFLTPREVARRLRIIKSSATATQASHRIRVQVSKVYKFMRQHGLPNHFPRNGRGGRLPSANHGPTPSVATEYP